MLKNDDFSLGIIIKYCAAAAVALVIAWSCTSFVLSTVKAVQGCSLDQETVFNENIFCEK